ncbi:MAG: endolytic transglycosylase MltG [Lachnospiraceae bacterium]|nr:endolytic transglycosylase MltG [Lachnospiraceae bacterium]
MGMQSEEAAEEQEHSSRREDMLHYVKIFATVIILVAVIVLCYLGYFFGRELFNTSGVSQTRAEYTEYTIHIEKGESTLTVGRELKKAGIIRNPMVFWVQTKLFKCIIEPGDYLVNSRTSSMDIAKQLNSTYRLKGSGE